MQATMQLCLIVDASVAGPVKPILAASRQPMEDFAPVELPAGHEVHFFDMVVGEPNGDVYGVKVVGGTSTLAELPAIEIAGAAGSGRELVVTLPADSEPHVLVAGLPRETRVERIGVGLTHLATPDDLVVTADAPGEMVLRIAPRDGRAETIVTVMFLAD